MSQPPQPALEADFTFATEEPFRLAAGGELQPVTLRYAVYGELNRRRDNAILVCHALSGSARVAEWWAEMFGPGRPFDLSRWCVLGVNVLGSCYGSTGPCSINPRTDRPYAGDFPVVSIDDMVRAQAELVDHLGIRQLHAVVGGSIGGMQALAWATRFPQRVARCVAIGAAPVSAMGLALSHLQRQAIRSDPAWRGGHYSSDEAPVAGLALARAIAMCTYKSAELYEERYGRRPNRRTPEDPWRTPDGRFDVAGYLDYQGDVFIRRFDANCYLTISRAMDTFEIGGAPGAEAETLERIRAKVLLVGISSDWLFPAADVRALAERMRGAGVEAEFAELRSPHGHDAFLAEAGLLAPLLTPLLAETRTAAAHGER
jgi:homoserine O-acetyltransferase/O-succinyltransferase